MLDQFAGREADLVAAVELLRNTIQESAIKRIAEKYFSGGEQNLRRILRDPPSILRSTHAVKEQFLEFYEDRAPPSGNLRRAYDTISRIIDAPQYRLNSYTGRYLCYRLSRTPREIISGQVEIFEESGVSRFLHRSIQMTPTLGQKNFNHEGLVFLMGNRLYFLGMGISDYGSYIRTMIIRAEDKPSLSPLVGMILSETVDNIPMASKTVLFEESLDRKLREDDEVTLGKNGFQVRLMALLKNESENIDCLYGWKR